MSFSRSNRIIEWRPRRNTKLLGGAFFAGSTSCTTCVRFFLLGLAIATLSAGCVQAGDCPAPA